MTYDASRAVGNRPMSDDQRSVLESAERDPERRLTDNDPGALRSITVMGTWEDSQRARAALERDAHAQTQTGRLKGRRKP